MTTAQLRQLPMTWETAKLKTIVTLRASRTAERPSDVRYIGLENIESWTGRLVNGAESAAPAADDENAVNNAVSLFEPGDLLFGKLRPYLAKAYLAQESGVCTPELLVMAPGEDVDARYLLRVLLSREFIARVDAETFGTRMPRADWDTIGNIAVPLPNIAEQHAIADYLDRETAELDALIATKKRLLALLAEKRRAQITRAVTRGLDPHALTRDSGVEGLGRIPQTWEVERLRWFIYSLEQGWSPQAEDREPQGDEWGVLKLNAVKGGEYDDSKVKALSTSLDVPSSLEVRPGDFLVTRANTPELVGDVCYVLATRPRRMISDLIYRLRLDGDRLDGRFLSYLLQSPVGRSQIEVAARGSSGSMVKISQDHLLDWLLLVPPIDEQRAIVSFIEREISRLDTLRSAAERTIMIAHERRAALIMEAINGRVPAAV